MRSSGAGMTPDLSAQHPAQDLAGEAQCFWKDAWRAVVIIHHVLIVPCVPVTELPWKPHPGLLMISSK